MNHGPSQRNYKGRSLQWKWDASEESSVSPTPTMSPMKKSAKPSLNTCVTVKTFWPQWRRGSWDGMGTWRNQACSLKKIIQGTVQLKRRRGRQRKRWADNIKWTRKTFAETQALAHNRQDWSRLVQRSLEQRPYDPGTSTQPPRLEPTRAAFIGAATLRPWH